MSAPWGRFSNSGFDGHQGLRSPIALTLTIPLSPQVVQPVVTAYSAAPLGGQYEKVVKTVETVPGAAVYASPAEYHVYEHQQPGAVFVKSVQEQVVEHDTSMRVREME